MLRKKPNGVLPRINAYPLSQFDGKVKTTDWSSLREYPGAKGDAEVKWVEPEKDTDVLPAILDEVPPLPGEGAMYAPLGRDGMRR